MTDNGPAHSSRTTFKIGQSLVQHPSGLLVAGRMATSSQVAAPLSPPGFTIQQTNFMSTANPAASAQVYSYPQATHAYGSVSALPQGPSAPGFVYPQQSAQSFASSGVVTHGPSAPHMAFHPAPSSMQASAPMDYPSPNAPTLSIDDCLNSGKAFENLKTASITARELLQHGVTLKRLLDLKFNIPCFHALGFTFDDLLRAGLDKKVLLQYPELRRFNSWAMFYGKDWKLFLELSMDIEDLLKMQLSITDHHVMNLKLATMFDMFSMSARHLLRIPFSYPDMKHFGITDDVERILKRLGLGEPDIVDLIKLRSWPILLFLPWNKELSYVVLVQSISGPARLKELGIERMDDLFRSGLTAKVFVNMPLTMDEWIGDVGLSAAHIDRLQLDQDDWHQLKQRRGWDVERLKQRWSKLPSVLVGQVKLGRGR